MRALWPLGEATVREVREAMAGRRPRAYTTVMTILDRLAQKGIVSRRKAGRAYVYRPNVSAEQARAFALGQLVENYFGGEKQALDAYLREVALTAGAEIFAAAGDTAREAVPRPARKREKPEPPAAGEPRAAGRLDESLL